MVQGFARGKRFSPSSLKAEGRSSNLQHISCPPRASNLNPPTDLFRLFMNRVLVAETAEFLKLQFIRSVPLIFHRGIISSLALCTG
jgi:hypothetical protein